MAIEAQLSGLLLVTLEQLLRAKDSHRRFEHQTNPSLQHLSPTLSIEVVLHRP
jgi:hypothetical protein